LDFGGKVGRHGSVRRAFLKEGRYIYAGFYAKHGAFTDVMEKALIKVAGQAGVEVD
jgi:hypothetical protein